VQVVPVAGGTAQIIALKDVAQINPPPVKWTGSLTANGLVTRGNSHTDNLGLTVNAVRRAEKDRITLGAGYYYGREKDRDTDEAITTIDNWFVLGKYDYFLTKKFYLYGAVRAEQDGIADLNLRLTASGGVGYQRTSSTRAARTTWPRAWPITWTGSRSSVTTRRPRKGPRKRTCAI
jgi:hypothetical protein